VLEPFITYFIAKFPEFASENILTVG